MDARTVTGLAVGVHCAAMPQCAQGVDAGLDDGAFRLAIEGGDQADATRIVLLRGGIGFLQRLCVGLPGCQEVGD